MRKLALLLSFLTSITYAQLSGLKTEVVSNIVINNKNYTVVIGGNYYRTEPKSNESTSKDALYTALVKIRVNKIEEDNKILKNELNKLRSDIIFSSLPKLFKISSDHSRISISSAKLVLEKEYKEALKNILNGSIYLAMSVVKTIVQPKIILYLDIKDKNDYCNEIINKAKNDFKNGFSFEEAFDVYQKLYNVEPWIKPSIKLINKARYSNELKIDDKELEEIISKEPKSMIKIDADIKEKLEKVVNKSLEEIYNSSVFKDFLLEILDNSSKTVNNEREKYILEKN